MPRTSNSLPSRQTLIPIRSGARGGPGAQISCATLIVRICVPSRDSGFLRVPNRSTQYLAGHVGIELELSIPESEKYGRAPARRKKRREKLPPVEFSRPEHSESCATDGLVARRKPPAGGTSRVDRSAPEACKWRPSGNRRRGAPPRDCGTPEPRSRLLVGGQQQVPGLRTPPWWLDNHSRDSHIHTPLSPLDNHSHTHHTRPSWLDNHSHTQPRWRDSRVRTRHRNRSPITVPIGPSGERTGNQAASSADG
jgi:hypothetical protein